MDIIIYTPRTTIVHNATSKRQTRRVTKVTTLALLRLLCSELKA